MFRNPASLCSGRGRKEKRYIYKEDPFTGISKAVGKSVVGQIRGSRHRMTRLNGGWIARLSFRLCIFS